MKLNKFAIVFMVFLVTLLSIGSVSAVSNHNSILDISLDHNINCIDVNDLSKENTVYTNLSIGNNSSCKNINNKTKVLSIPINNANCFSSCFKNNWSSFVKINCSKPSVGCVDKSNSSYSPVVNVNKSICSKDNWSSVDKINCFKPSVGCVDKINCFKPSVGCVDKINCSDGNFRPNIYFKPNIHYDHCSSGYWKNFHWFVNGCDFNKSANVCWNGFHWFVKGCDFNKFSSFCWNFNHYWVIWKYFNCFMKDSCSCNSSLNSSGSCNSGSNCSDSCNSSLNSSGSCNSSFNNSSSNCTSDSVNTTTNSSSNCTFDSVNTTTNSSNMVGKVNTTIKVPVNVYINNSNFKIPIKNVTIIFNGETKVVNVNDGHISLTLPDKGVYELFIKFKGCDKFKTSNVTVNITVLPLCTNVSVNNICGKPCSHKCIFVNVTDEFGNPIKTGTVSTIIDNISYTADVLDGKARFDVVLPNDTGSSPFNVDYEGNDYYDPSYATGIMEIIDNITNSIANHTNNNSHDNSSHTNNNKNKDNGNSNSNGNGNGHHNYDPNSNKFNNGREVKKENVSQNDISDKISKVSTLPKTGNPLLLLLVTLLSLPILKFKK